MHLILALYKVGAAVYRMKYSPHKFHCSRQRTKFNMNILRVASKMKHADIQIWPLHYVLILCTVWK